MRSFPQDCRKTAYVSLVRSLLDYGSVIWDPYLKQDIDKLERVQRQAARFITGDYKTREEGCVTRILETLELSSLEQRRSFNRLVFLYKVVEVLVPDVSPDVFLKPKTQISKNIVDRHSVTNDRSFVIKTVELSSLNNLSL